MTEIMVRDARLDDTGAISTLFRARVEKWQRLNTQGQVEDLAYDDLTVYERWLHGSRSDSPWMSVETGAIYLSHLLCGAGLPLVAAEGREVLAYAEAYHSAEPEPYGDHLHIAHLIVPHERSHAGLEDLLIRHLKARARTMADCRRLTASCADYDTNSAGLYQGFGMSPLARVQRCAVPARTGQGFYKAGEHLPADAEPIKGWHMLIGRLESARQHWEMLWPRLWEAVPEINARRTHRLRITAAGQDALVCCQQQLYTPRNAEVYCWSPRALTSHLLVAIRDWAHREGYRTLMMAVAADNARALGADAEPDPYHQDFYAVDF